MKYHYIATLAAVAAVAAAKPHQRIHLHRHAHVERMAHPDSAVYVPAAVKTITVYELDGHPISEDEARMGIANGTLRWGDDNILSTFTISPVALPTTPPLSSSQEKESVQRQPTTTEVSQIETQPPVPSVEQSSTAVAPTSSLKPASSQESPPAMAPDTSPDTSPDTFPDNYLDTSPDTSPDTLPEDPNDLVDKYGNCTSCEKPFPNGVIPCSQFPYGYGAMPLNNEGLGGWSGIQDPGYRGGDGFDDIRTVAKGSCSDGSCCARGTYCSYGCPNPYLKLSFPKKQGKTGQTVGGLYCNDHGMLEMADGSIGKTLCGKGSNKMAVKVHNKLSKPVSICRTDYPGEYSSFWHAI